MKTGQLIQGHWTGDQALFEIIATVIIGLRLGPWSHAGIWTFCAAVGITSHTQPIVRLGLLETQAPLFILQSKEMAAVLTILETLLPASQPIPIVWKRRLKNPAATRDQHGTAK